MSQIPITQDYAKAVGNWCEKVENRSLLLDKFALPKNWGEAVKENSASSWSLMRIASNGSALLRSVAADCQRRSRGHNVTSENADALRASARVVTALSHTQVGGLDALRKEHTARFLELLRAAYPAERLVIVSARLEGRLAINLAEGVIQNAGISLDRIFGLPLIPGSAVKGIARHAAWLEVQETPEKQALLNRVFGADDSSNQGAVSFLQATPTNATEIVVDITNVHYPNYYQGKEPVAKTERPQPNTFPVVERGAEFAFPIVLNGLDLDPALLEAAKRWLLAALTENGLGAKTAAGYGWFSDMDAELRAKEEAERAAAEAERKRVEEAAAIEKIKKDAFDALSPDERINTLKIQIAALPDEQFAAKAKTIAALPEEEQRAIIRLFSESKDKKKRLKTWRKKKPEIANVLADTATTLKEILP